MSKKLRKKHMTRFDYNIRLLSIVSGIVFVATLAFVFPLLDNINASLEKTNNAIKIQNLENNFSKYDNSFEVVSSLNNE